MRKQSHRQIHGQTTNAIEITIESEIQLRFELKLLIAYGIRGCEKENKEINTNIKICKKVKHIKLNNIF